MAVVSEKMCVRGIGTLGEQFFGKLLSFYGTSLGTNVRRNE